MLESELNMSEAEIDGMPLQSFVAYLQTAERRRRQRIADQARALMIAFSKDAKQHLDELERE